MAESPSISRIVTFGSLVSLLLTALAAAMGVFFVLRSGQADPRELWILAGACAAASLLLMMAGLVFPDLFAECKLRFPLNLTLPIVYTLLLMVVSAVFVTRANVLEAPVDELRVLDVLRRTDVLMTSAALQMLVLSGFVGILRPESQNPQPPVEPSVS